MLTDNHRKREVPEYLQKIGWTLLGTLLLLGAGLYNGYPLVTSDTGTYIMSGFKPYIPADRPVVYGLFVRHSSMFSSFWFTIIAQSLILSYVLWQVLNLFSSASLGRTSRLAIILLLVFFTGISWYSSQLMPDIFTAIGILAMAVFLFSEVNLFRDILLSIFVVASSLMHNSNLLLNTMLVVLAFLFAIRQKLFREGIIRKRRMIVLFSLMVASWLIAPAVNYLIGDSYRLTGTPHAFLVGKTIENGTMDRYLKAHCDSIVMKTLPDSGLYHIFAKHSDKFLDVESQSFRNGARLHQWEFLNASNQQFYILKVSKGYYKIISKNSNKCLEVPLKDTAKLGAILVQNIYSGTDNQLFSFKKIDWQDYWMIANKASNLQVDIAGLSTENGAFATQWTYTGADNQQFAIARVPGCLCLFKDKLPNTAIRFLWEPNSVFAKTGGWSRSKDEYNSILRSIYLSPRYLGSNVGNAILSTLEQLTRIEIGDGFGGYDEKSAPSTAIDATIKSDLKPFSNSRENRWSLNLTEANNRQYMLMVFSLIVLVCFFRISKLRRTISDKFRLFIYFSFLAIVLNAFVTGAMANVLDRLQCRVVWFIPMIAFILLFNVLSPYLKKIISERVTDK